MGDLGEGGEVGGGVVAMGVGVGVGVGEGSDQVAALEAVVEGDSVVYDYLAKSTMLASS